MSTFKKILIGLVAIMVIGAVFGNNKKDEEPEEKVSDVIEIADQEEMEKEEKEIKEQKNGDDNLESGEKSENNDKEFDGISDAFRQGFEDNFEISEENRENIDSIKENIDEIANDPEVQEAYEGCKESVNNLLGGNED